MRGQPLNASLPITCTLEGMDTVASPAELNALAPIAVIVLGISISSNELQSLKVDELMMFRDVERVTSERFLQPWKALNIDNQRFVL